MPPVFSLFISQGPRPLRRKIFFHVAFFVWVRRARLKKWLRGERDTIAGLKSSPTGTRTRVVWVKTTYPDQLDYWGSTWRPIR